MSETAFIERGCTPSLWQAETKSQPGSASPPRRDCSTRVGRPRSRYARRAARVSGWRATSRVLPPLPRRKRMRDRSKSRSSRRRSRTLEFLAAVVLRIETIARSRRSSGRSPAQPASSARMSSSVALFVGVSSDGRSGLSAARRRDRRNGLSPRRPSSTSQITNERKGRTYALTLFADRVWTGACRRDRPSASGAPRQTPLTLGRTRRYLPEPAQPLRETRAELDAEVEMLLLEPGGAEAEDRPAAADLVERRGHLRHEGRVADRIRPDHEPNPDALGRSRPGRDRQPSLEDGTVRVADDRVEVVPRPQRRIPLTIGAAATRPDARSIEVKCVRGAA